MRRALAALGIALVLPLSAGCEMKRYDFRGDHTGVVTGYSWTKAGRQIVVRSDLDGHDYFYGGNRSTVRKCPVGARWPDCKKGKKR